MPFGQATNTQKKKPEADIIFKRRPIQIENLATNKSSGYKYAFIGKQYSGKTINGLDLLHVNLDFGKDFKEPFPIIHAALKNGLIPNVERAFVMESENNMANQLSHGLERDIFKDVADRIDRVGIDLGTRFDKMNKDRSVSVSLDSVEEIEHAHDQYRQCMGIIKDLPETHMYLLDSGSRLYNLLNTKQELLVQKRTPRNASDEVKKGIKQSSWQWRNSWWNDIFTTLRGAKGFGVTTFMISDTPDHFVKPGEKPYKVRWANYTEFNFDQIYQFYLTNNQKLRVKIDPYSKGRYVSRGDNAVNDWEVKMGRFGFFPALEAMLKTIGEY